MSNIESLFNNWIKDDTCQIIQLLNSKQELVAAIYTDKVKLENIAICETQKISERYYIYLNGIAVFFTYYKKINKGE